MKLPLKIMASIAIFLLNYVALASPSSADYTQDKTGIVITADQPRFTIKLKSNPTTGYSWFLREYHPSFLEPIHYQFYPGDTKLVGASGADVWTFHVKPSAFVVPQQTIIRFVYLRPWEGQGQLQQAIFRVSTVTSSAHLPKEK
jgi:inhibitor of cysteine peptidase